MAKNANKIKGAQLYRIAKNWQSERAAYVRMPDLRMNPREAMPTDSAGPTKRRSTPLPPLPPYSRNSAVSLLWQRNLQENGPRKLFEPDQAAIKRDRSNVTLVKHHFKQLKVQEDMVQRFPAVVRKLINIMSENERQPSREDPDEVAPPPHAYDRRMQLPPFCLGAMRQNYDFKPQACNNINKWMLKLPRKQPASGAQPTEAESWECRRKKLDIKWERTSQELQERRPKATVQVPLGEYSRPCKPKRKPLGTELGRRPLFQKHRRKLKMLLEQPLEELTTMQQEQLSRNWHLDGVCIPRLDC